MSVLFVRLTAGAALVVVAVVGAACGAEQTPERPASAVTPSAPFAAPATVVPAEELGRSRRTVLGLVALGELGVERGSTEAVRSLAGRTAVDGRVLDEQIREPATSAGLALGDDVGPEVQAVLTDLRPRSGRSFDAAWLRAVTGLVGEGQSAAADLRSVPGASTDVQSLAGNVQARLAALSNALRKATTRAAAPTR